MKVLTILLVAVSIILLAGCQTHIPKEPTSKEEAAALSAGDKAYLCGVNGHRVKFVKCSNK